MEAMYVNASAWKETIGSMRDNECGAFMDATATFIEALPDIPLRIEIRVDGRTVFDSMPEKETESEAD